MTPGEQADDVTLRTVLDAVLLEQSTFTESLRSSPEAALVRQLAALMDEEQPPRDIATVSREFRAALDELREAVARAGKRGDAVDEIGARRATRRAASAAPSSPAVQQ